MIDVLIPVYNAERTIRGSLRSILDQTIREFRVVVVDDGSTDRTPDILRDIAESDRRVTVLAKENGGIVDALNFGLARCDAEIIARHDGDDIAFPHRFEAQLAYLQTNPDCIAVGGNAWHINGRGRRLASYTWLHGDVTGHRTSTPAIEPYILHPFLMARRSAIASLGGYRHVFHAEDSDLYWRMLEKGRLHNLDTFLGQYRIHTGGVSSRGALNARVSAVTSQLAAISAGRRAERRKDLAFSKDDLKRFETASNFRAILAIAAEGLDEDEAAALPLAAAAKLIELRTYRRFRLTFADLRMIASIIRTDGHRLTPTDRRRLWRNVRRVIRPKLGIKSLLLRLRDRTS